MSDLVILSNCEIKVTEMSRIYIFGKVTSFSLHTSLKVHKVRFAIFPVKGTESSRISNRHRRLDYSPTQFIQLRHAAPSNGRVRCVRPIHNRSRYKEVPARWCWPGLPHITCDASRIRCQGHIMGAWARHHVVTARAWENSEQVALTGCVQGWENQVQVAMIQFPRLLVKYIASGK